MLIIGVFLCLGVGAVFAIQAAPDVMRCYMVRWSPLAQIEPRLYIDPEMPPDVQEKFADLVEQSKGRVAGLYGEYSATPTIIAGHTMDVMRVYGGNAYNRAGRTRITPVATFVILGPDGMRNLDILAHELGHAELAARVGSGKLSLMPNWFDEGLAMQFDERVSVTAWRDWTGGRQAKPDLSQVGVIAHDDWLGYAAAKYEVHRWLEVVGQEGFLAFLEAIRDGAEFEETYQSIEGAYQK